MTVGIECPVCGTALSNVTDTRARPGFIVRKRVCFNDHTFRTREAEYVPPERRKRVSVREQALALLAAGDTIAVVAQKLKHSIDYVTRVSEGTIDKPTEKEDENDD